MEANAQRRTRDRERQTRKFSWPLAFTLVALIAAASFAVAFWRLETWPARTARQANAELEHVAKGLREAFVEIGHLQPRITVNNRVYVEETTPTAELTILSRQLQVEHEMLHTWAGSTKRVKLHGTFVAKAGFDLRDEVSVTANDQEITVHVPHAIVLGVEQKQVEVVALENGFWNRISTADLESELMTLPQLARQQAADTGLAAEADRTLGQQLAARVQSERPIRVVFGAKEPKR
jgi:hypothetical protein